MIDSVVVDLDDTLLDTSRLLVPLVLPEALRQMIDAGLPMSPAQADAALAALRREGSKEVFVDLARQAGVDERIGRIGARAFFEFDPPGLDLTPDVAAALDDLERRAPLVLLTTGHERTQRAKIERLGIAPKFVECIVVPPDLPGEKETPLRDVLERHAWVPERSVMIGDRPQGDIRAGNAVGCKTILVRRPGAEYADTLIAPTDRPWKTVESFAEVPGVLFDDE